MYTQDVADFSPVVDEPECLEEELEEDEIALRRVLEDFTAEEGSNDGIEVEGDNWTWEAEDSRFSLYHLFRPLTSQRTLILTCTSFLNCTSGYSKIRFHESSTTVLETYFEST